MKYFLSKWVLLPSALFLTVFSATACLGSTTSAAESTAIETVSSSAESAITDITASYSQKDLNTTWDDSTAAHIALNNETITADKSDGISIDGSNITITKAGTYVISGKLAEGQIVVDAADTDDVWLVLNNAEIANSKTSPVFIKNADKTIITLPPGTVNTISDSENYTFLEGEDEPDAALFSQNDLTINGSGKLLVDGNYRNGIASKDDLVITGGTINVTAKNDALRGRDSVSIKDGIITLTAGGDGIKANQDADRTKGWICLDGGQYTITAENDAIQAETILKINDGNYTIKTGGGSQNAAVKTSQDNFGMGRKNGGTLTEREKMVPADTNNSIQEDMAASQNETDVSSAESYKGLKAGTLMLINGGSFQMDTNDDAVHTNGSMTITNGSFTIATGDDAFHADQDFIIEDGTIQISKCYEGIEGATVTINGGTIDLTASDDGINSAGGTENSTSQDSFRSNGNNWIRITGGNLAIDAKGDGIDSNGDIYIDGGTVIVNGPANGGDSAVDFDGKCTITGGTLIGVGAAGMAQTPDSGSTQNSLMVTYQQTQSAGTLVHLEDANGNAVITFAPKRDYQSLLISTPVLSQGDTYILSTGGTSTGQNYNGLYFGGSYSGGSKLTEITLSAVSTSVSSDGNTVTSFSRQGGGRGGQRPDNGQLPSKPFTEANNIAQ